MSSQRVVLVGIGIGIALAGCTPGADDADPSSSAAPSDSTPVPSVVSTVPGGVHLVGEAGPRLTDVEARSCVRVPSRRRQVYDWLVANLDADDVPVDALPRSIAVWANDNAELAREACEALGFDSVILRNSTRRSDLEFEAERLLAEVVEWSESSFEFSMLADEGVSDSGVVWCAANFVAVTEAADVLKIGITDSPELDYEATVTETGSESSGSWTVPDFTSASDQILIWMQYHVDRVGRACKAAFGAQ